MTARANILARLRGNGAGETVAARARLARRARNTIPQTATGSAPELLARFTAQLTRVAATHEEIASLEALPQAVARVLARDNLPARIKLASNLVGGIAWTDQTTLEIHQGSAAISDVAALTRADAGIAETGTLVFTSGPDRPNALNFSPDLHIAVIDRAAITGSLEDALGAVRAQAATGAFASTVNLVTGPSQTGDINQTLYRGAHGPKRLHVVIVAHGDVQRS